MDGTIFSLNPEPSFKDGPGPVLGPVGGEFQPRLETGYPGGGTLLTKLCRLSRLDPFGRLKDIVDFIPSP
jgi:hypothetical protein